MTEVALGVIMGLVAGIMVFIAIRELLPKAMLYDSSSHVSGGSVISPQRVEDSHDLLMSVSAAQTCLRHRHAMQHAA